MIALPGASQKRLIQWGLFKVLDEADFLQADEKRDRSEDAEAAVDETPGAWNAADWTCDEGERNDGGAGDDAELKYPFVADRVAPGANEDDRENEMGEGKPVSSVGEEGIALACVLKGVVNFGDPTNDRVRKYGMRGEEQCEPAGFVFEREGSESTQNKADNKEKEPKANGTKELWFGLEWRGHLRSW